MICCRRAAVNAIASSHDAVRHVPSAAREHRVVEAVGIVVDVDGGEALVAGEALGDGMVAVGRQLHQHAVVDLGHQPARRLADPAERPHLAHRPSVG